MQSRLLACASAALIVASALQQYTIPDRSDAAERSDGASNGKHDGHSQGKLQLRLLRPSAATPSRPSQIGNCRRTENPEGTACTNCDGNTIYLLKNATDFDYYDPQRIYTPEDEAFFWRHDNALTASPTNTRQTPRTRRRSCRTWRTDTGTTNSDATIVKRTRCVTGSIVGKTGRPSNAKDMPSGRGVAELSATDVINGGPTYAIKYLSVPKAEDGTSQYKGPYSGERTGRSRPVICDGNTITFHLDRTLYDFNYATDARLRRSAKPTRSSRCRDSRENYIRNGSCWSDGPYQITNQQHPRHRQLP